LFVGAVFVFSGFVKAVDPMGSSIKYTDYFHSFGLEFLIDFVFPLAIILSTIEFMVGLSLILNIKIKLNSTISFLFMAFFTPLTFYLAIANPVTDCGCFGDALVITNWQTFWKNIVILMPTLIIFFNRNDIKAWLSKINELILIGFGIIAITWFSIYCDQHLPVLDFRPYKIGNNISALQKEIYELDENIPEEKAILDKVPINERQDSVITTFIYEKDGVQKEFSEVPEDTTWQWIETKNNVIREGYHPPIHDFSITDLNGNDITKQVLSDTAYSFFIISYKIEKADLDGIIAATKLAASSTYNFYFLTASLNEDIEELNDTLVKLIDNKTIEYEAKASEEKHVETIYYYEKDGEVMEFTVDEIPNDDTWEYIGEEEIESTETSLVNPLPFNFYTTDETTLKTIIRSNPGLVLVKNGTVINKWAYMDIPESIDDVIVSTPK
jgi:energy-coupling factor transporter transmembrane protein EcfT